MITICIVRPNHGMQLIVVENAHLSKGYMIFPDNKPKKDSAFPREGVTITSKHQGHLVIAHQHMEKWVLSGFSSETVDLGLFAENWKGCRAMIFSEDYIQTAHD